MPPSPPEPVASPTAVPAAYPSQGRPAIAAALLILAAVALHLGALRWGFLYDDFLHQYMLRGLGAEVGPRTWNLYDFDPAGAGGRGLATWHFSAWFADPQFTARFFRPVTSLSIWLDYQLFGGWSPGYHLTSLLLFAIFLLLVWRLYRRLGLPAAAGLWALAFVGFDDAHTLPVGWIANRNSLLAALFCVATVLALDRHVRSGRRRDLLLCGGLFLLACGSKESGLAAFPLALLYLATYGGPAAGAGADARSPASAPNTPYGGLHWRRMLTSPAAWLLGLLAVAYLVFYVAGEFGARSALYPVPWEDPGTYLVRLALLVPLAMANFVFGLPLDLAATVLPRWWPLVVALVPILAVAAAVYLRAVGWSRAVLFAAGWIAISLVVEAGGEVSDRLLTSTSVGMGLLFGLLLGGAARRHPATKLRAGSGTEVRGAEEGAAARGENRGCESPFPHTDVPEAVPASPPAFFNSGQPTRRVIGSAARALTVLLVLVGLPGAVAGHLLRSTAFFAMARLDRDRIADAALPVPATAPRQVILLNAPSAMLALSFAPTWNVLHPDPRTDFFPLQLAGRGLTCTRAGERVLTVTAAGSAFIDNRLERLLRYRDPPRPGQVFRTAAFTATALTVEAGGVRELRLEFERPLEDPGYIFLAYRDGRMQPIAPPAPGQTLALPAVNPAYWFAP